LFLATLRSVLHKIFLGKGPYLERKRSYHIDWVSIRHLHFHLPNKAWLCQSSLLIPKLPFSFGKHTVSQLTQQSFLSSGLPPHKKLHCIRVISFTTLTGAL
jgi:hypothetical protein